MLKENDIQFVEDGHKYFVKGVEFEGQSASKIAGYISGLNYDGVNQELLNKSAEAGTRKHNLFEEIINSNGKFPEEINCEDEEDLNFFTNEVLTMGTDWRAEVPVATDDLEYNYVGKLDMVCKSGDKYFIGDTKTGQFHRYYTTIQLSLYRMAFSKMNNIPLDKIELFCFDCKGINSRIREIQPIDEQDLIEMVEASALEIPYEQRGVASMNSLMARVCDAFEVLASKKKEIEAQENEYNEVLNQLYEAMNEKGILKLETDSVKFTLIAPTTARGWDTKKLEEEKPELVELYKTKVTNKKGYLRVTEK